MLRDSRSPDGTNTKFFGDTQMNRRPCYLLLVLFGRSGVIGSFLHGVFGIQITFTWKGAALASAVVSFPLMLRAIRLAFEGVDSRLVGAARSLGRNHGRAAGGRVPQRLGKRGALRLPPALRSDLQRAGHHWLSER